MGIESMPDKNEFQRVVENYRNSDNHDLSEKVMNWLTTKWCVPRPFVDEFFEIQASSYFLLIWPIFEHDVCNGYMTSSKIRDIAKKYKNCYDEMCIDDILKRFYDRYTDRNSPDSHWNSLCQNDLGEVVSQAERVLNQPWNKSKPVEKIQFGLYVIYRFRNNIFHGNKTVLEWLRNKPQIEDCVLVLLRLTEFHDKLKASLEKNKA